ncbi:MAG: helix-turn-helix domain-containing protein [Nitrospinae bacterium]|nr:helix-turn-helix domain-containing protein [Nitrospinota bacterium]
MPREVRRLTHYEILNLPVFAPPEAIQRAYVNLTALYSETSLASYHALTGEERAWMLERVRKAYETLMDPAARAGYDAASLSLEEREQAARAQVAASTGSAPMPPLPAPPVMEERAGFVRRRISGAELRSVREARGASLDEIAELTKVKKSYLEAIEADDVARFPAPVFFKGFLKAYAKALGLNPAEIAERYLAG